MANFFSMGNKGFLCNRTPWVGENFGEQVSRKIGRCEME